MRRLSVAIALLAVTAASASNPLPRGSQDFRLAGVRSKVDSAIAARGLTVVSSSHSHIACLGPAGPVEFEQYDFAPSAHGEGRLWRVTVAYRVPYSRADFDSVRAQLEVDLGEPAQVDEPTARHPEELHKLMWVDARTAVMLAARWPERPDPRTDRMVVVWTDRKLQKIVEAQRRGKKE